MTFLPFDTVDVDDVAGAADVPVVVPADADDVALDNMRVILSSLKGFLSKFMSIKPGPEPELEPEPEPGTPKVRELKGVVVGGVGGRGELLSGAKIVVRSGVTVRYRCFGLEVSDVEENKLVGIELTKDLNASKAGEAEGVYMVFPLAASLPYISVIPCKT